MNNYYKPPEADLRTQIEELTTMRKITVFLVVTLFCYLGVSHISSIMNDLFITLIVDRDSAQYRNVRMLSDLLQSTFFLFVGGMIIGKRLKQQWWVACSILSLLFVLNTLRIVGINHIFYEACDQKWYDILIIIKTPFAFFAGGFIGVKRIKSLTAKTATELV